MTFALGLDISTTATKALLVDGRGRVVATASREYSYDAPQSGWSEQDPALWWTGAVGAIGDLFGQSGITGADVDAVGLAGQMHGLVLLDSGGDIIRPAILWNDQRTAEECDEIRRRVGAAELIALTGNDALPGFTAPKIEWVRKHEPDSFKQVARFMLPKDYVRYRLTGSIATDVADGSGTLLMNVAERRWSEQMVEAVGLRLSQVPDLVEGPEFTGSLSADAASVTGLLAGTPVVGGGGDQAANAVGVGAVDAATGAMSLGTSGVVFVPSPIPVVEPQGRVHAFCHAVPNMWHAMGVMLSAAGSLRWYRDAIAPGTSFDELAAEAGTVPAGADGLRFLPYLSGERTPHSDPNARGAFVGLTVRHGRPHLSRAVLEGVAFGLADGLDLMEASGISVPPVFHASGGGTRSRLWRQIIADVSGASIKTVRTVEGAAFGAALLAGVGIGIWPSVQEAVRCVETVDVTAPGADRAAYLTAHESYRALYPALRDTFSGLN